MFSELVIDDSQFVQVLLASFIESIFKSRSQVVATSNLSSFALGKLESVKKFLYNTIYLFSLGHICILGHCSTACTSTSCRN